MSIGDNLRRIRKEKSLTQVELANKTGLKQTTISAIEVGKNIPSGATISLLVDALKVSADELMGEAAEQSGPVLTAQDRELLRVIRKMSSAGRESVLNYAKFTLSQEAPQKETSMSSAG